MLSPGGKILFPPSARAEKMKWAFLDQVAWESNYIFSFGCIISSKIGSKDECVDWSKKGNVGSLAVTNKDLHWLSFALVCFKTLETWNSTKESWMSGRWWVNKRYVFNLMKTCTWEQGLSVYWSNWPAHLWIPSALVNGWSPWKVIASLLVTCQTCCASRWRKRETCSLLINAGYANKRPPN